MHVVLLDKQCVCRLIDFMKMMSRYRVASAHVTSRSWGESNHHHSKVTQMLFCGSRTRHATPKWAARARQTFGGFFFILLLHMDTGGEENGNSAIFCVGNGCRVSALYEISPLVDDDHLSSRGCCARLHLRFNNLTQPGRSYEDEQWNGRRRCAAITARTTS